MCRLLIATILATTLLLASPAGIAAAEMPSALDTEVPGVTAEITQARRKDGVLTVQMRLVNGSSSEQSFYVVNNRNYDAFYVVAKNKKYFVLRDSEKTPLAPPADAGGGVRVRIKPGASWTWWARYPAPPSEVTSISYYTPLTAPFDDVPISDQR
jgi:hypothetical protein